MSNERKEEAINFEKVIKGLIDIALSKDPAKTLEELTKEIKNNSFSSNEPVQPNTNDDVAKMIQELDSMQKSYKKDVVPPYYHDMIDAHKTLDNIREEVEKLNLKLIDMMKKCKDDSTERHGSVAKQIELMHFKILKLAKSEIESHELPYVHVGSRWQGDRFFSTFSLKTGYSFDLQKHNKMDVILEKYKINHFYI